MNRGNINFGEIASSKIVTISIILSFLVFIFSGYLFIREKILDVEKVITKRSSVSADLVSAVPPTFPSPANLTLLESPSQYGINIPNQQFPDARGTTGDAHMEEIRNNLNAAGVGWVRSDVTPNLMRVFFKNTDCGQAGLCDRDKFSDFQILGVIDHLTIDWAQTICEGDSRVNWDPPFAGTPRSKTFSLDDFKNVVDCVSKKFAGKVDAYEIWNEPTINEFKGGYQDGTAEHYFEMLKSAYEIIKQNDPSATVVGLGGLLVYYGSEDGSTKIEADKMFAGKVYELGGANYLDAISLHAYDWGFYKEAQRLNYYLDNAAYYKNLFNKPLWISETGHRENDNGTQSEYLKFAYSALINGGAERIFWFALKDHTSNPPNPDMDGAFGIIGRPVQEYMKSYIQTPKSGLLRIATNPSSDITIRVVHELSSQEMVRQWGIDWERLQTGDYTVEFLSNNSSLTMPPPQKIKINAQKVTSLLINPTNGSVQTAQTWEELEEAPFNNTPALLRIETNPAAEAKISVKSIQDQSVRDFFWGVDWEEFHEGTYEISFSYPQSTLNNKRIVIPSVRTIMLEKGKTTSVLSDLTTGTMLVSNHDSSVPPDFNAGRLRIETIPPKQVDISVQSQIDTNVAFGRQWSVDWERLESGNYKIIISPPKPPKGKFNKDIMQTITIQKGKITELKVDSNTGIITTSTIPE